jgi:chromosome segregation ATPase
MSNPTSSKSTKLEQYYSLKYYQDILTIQATQHDYSNYAAWTQEQCVIYNQIIEKEIQYINELYSKLTTLMVLPEFDTELANLKSKYQAHTITLGLKKLGFNHLIEKAENTQTYYVDTIRKLRDDITTLKTSLAKADNTISDLTNKNNNLLIIEQHNKNSDLRIKELEDKIQLVEDKLQKETGVLLQTLKELDSARNDFKNLKTTHEKDMNDLNKQKSNLEKEFKLKILEIEELNKNLQTRTTTLKRTESNLETLTKEQTTNPEQIAQLKTTTKELSEELLKAYSYLQEVVSERSLLLKGPTRLFDYQNRLETAFSDLERNAVSVHLQLYSFMDFKSQRDQVDQQLWLVQQQIITNTESITKLTMMMQMPDVPGAPRDNFQLAQERGILKKKAEQLSEIRRDLINQSNTNSNLEQANCKCTFKN